MEVLPLSGVQHVEDTDFVYDGESNNCIEHEKQVQMANCECSDLSVNVEGPQFNREGDFQGTVGYLPAPGHGNSDSYSDYQMDDQKASCGSPEFEFDDTNTDNYSTESCLASENSRIVVDTIENELPSNNKEGELSVSGPLWLDGDESVALWVKWRGKWQAGIRCARADWPLSTLKAKPTHDRKKYFVIFFPHTRNYSWADALLVRSIDEFPHPIAYKSHKAGLKLVEDVKVARRFIMKKLAVSMLNIIDQFHSEALIESARDILTWKEFAKEASRCNGYSDFGRMLMKLQNMIVQQFINSDWLQHSLHSWVQRCQNAQTAETIEILKEELVDAILWNEVNSLGDVIVQSMLSSEWKTWKHEVTKWFSTSNTLPIIRDTEQQGGEAFLATSVHVSRKRPKLEIRRGEAHASLVESKCSDQTMALALDSHFFNSQNSVNAVTLASKSRKEVELREITALADSLSAVPGRRDGIVAETGNLEFVSCKDVELTPLTRIVAAKSLNSGNKNRQCVAFIESKGRQCVRWANEGDVYCCVHLSSRFTGNSARKEQPLSMESPMCQGTTVLGTRCKHRSLYGSSFCKKHRPRSETQTESNSLVNKLNEKQEESCNLETTSYKEVKLGDVGSPLGVNEGNVTNYGTSLFDKLEHPENDSIASEILHCIGSCQHNDRNPCLESPKRHSLYCEKHLPSWLKRARNGKSRVISKEVFIDLLRDCSSHEQKIHLHQACELFYRLFKSILSMRNPVPMEVQFQWALSEASKDFGVGEQFVKLVCCEKERLKRQWGFSAEEDAQVSSHSKEVPGPLLASGHHDNDMSIRCKICFEEFLDDQVLSTHFMDSHKKEAQWLFRGYACAICLDSFTNKKVLETHVQERHHAPFADQCMLLQCIPCGSHFGNTEQLWLHVVAVHPVDFRLSIATQQHNSSAGEDSPIKPEPCNVVSLENDTKNVGGLRKFICRFCGLKFDLLPDLGRHHQAAHMEPSLVNPRPAKRGLHYYAHKLKSGKLGHPRFKKPLAAASDRIRNRAKATLKKHIQASKLQSTEIINLRPYVTAVAGSRELTEGPTVVKTLVSAVQKRKPSPTSSDILSIARSACCKVNFKVLMEQKFEVLPEHLYLEAAEVCSKNGVDVYWCIEGFVCPKGCETFKDPLLLPPMMPNPMSGRLKAGKCDYVIETRLSDLQVKENVIILCADISFGQELVPVVCVADEGQMNSLQIPRTNSDGQNAKYSMPWENFTYIKQPLLDKSLAIDTQSSQLGCACQHPLCSSETCDHVYLFDNDYDDAKDIYGNPMRRRFPYDENGRIILEEGYLVYECNQMCSCSRTCSNRVLQRGVQLKLEVFMTETKGWAVRASEVILRGSFICEYIGEVLDEQEANWRRNRYNSEGNCYLFDVDARINDISRLVEGSARFAIDATKYGNVSRFINHSCSPNLVTHQVLVESMEYERSHIGLYANRDIAAGEELTYDYQYELLPGEGCRCLCKSSNCRGRLH